MQETTVGKDKDAWRVKSTSSTLKAQRVSALWMNLNIFFNRPGSCLPFWLLIFKNYGAICW